MISVPNTATLTTIWVPPAAAAEVESELGGTFGGYTRSSVFGGWRNPLTGQWISEDMLLYQVVCEDDKINGRKWEERWQDFAKRLIHSFEQQEIWVYHTEGCLLKVVR